MMHCRACAREIDSDSSYCRFCGKRTTLSGPARRLTRQTSQARLAGVCAGLAEYLSVDVTLVRLAWVILTIIPGAIIGGVLAYLVCWLMIPVDEGAVRAAQAGRRLHRSDTNRRIAGVCGGLAEYFDVDPTAVRLLWMVLSIWPGVVVLGVVLYLIAWLVMPREGEVRFHSAPA